MQAAFLLYGCFHTDGRGYDFDVLAPADVPLAKRLMEARIPSPAWFLGSTKSSLFWGRRDYVGEVLGWDHAIAKDESRSLEFMSAYIVRRAARPPSWDEMAALDNRIASDVRRFGDDRRAARTALRADVLVDLPPFCGPGDVAKAGTWDDVSRSIAMGSDRLVLFDRQGMQTRIAPAGKVQNVTSGRPAQDDAADDEIQRLIDLKEQQSRGSGCLSRIIPPLRFKRRGKDR